MVMYDNEFQTSPIILNKTFTIVIVFHSPLFLRKIFEIGCFNTVMSIHHGFIRIVGAGVGFYPSLRPPVDLMLLKPR